ncbi:MAG: hypothetical protein GC187_06640 [Alphaproteobacteria bacterium]|nr:hypothetical protein [Alphaproteobacteria bacterium]
MSAMTMEFDGVRELSMEEVDAVSGGCGFTETAARIAEGAAIGAAVGAATGGFGAMVVYRAGCEAGS